MTVVGKLNCKPHWKHEPIRVYSVYSTAENVRATLIRENK